MRAGGARLYKPATPGDFAGRHLSSTQISSRFSDIPLRNPIRIPPRTDQESLRFLLTGRLGDQASAARRVPGPRIIGVDRPQAPLRLILRRRNADGVWRALFLHVQVVCGPQSLLRPESLKEKIPDTQQRHGYAGSRAGWNGNVTYFAGKVGFCVNLWGGPPWGVPAGPRDALVALFASKNQAPAIIEEPARGPAGPGHPRGRPPHQAMPMAGPGKVSGIVA